MNSDVNSSPIDSSLRKAAAPWKTYLLFIFVTSLYLLPFMRVMFVSRDEGSILTGAVRIIHGQVFARDFFEVMGSGNFYWMAAFFKVFGVTILATRISLFISSLGIGLCMYFLSRRVCQRYQALPCIVLAGTYMGAIWPGISHHVDGTFFALLSITCMVLWVSARRNALLLAAGFLAGVTTCIFQPMGVLLFCSLLVWLWIERRRSKAAFSVLVLPAVGYVAIVGVVLAYFWSKGALSSLYYSNFVFPRQSYGETNSISYAYGLVEHHWTPWVIGFGGHKWMLGMVAILIVPFLFVAVLPPLMLLIGILGKRKPVTPEVALYWLSGWAIWLSEIHRPDIYHLVFGSSLLIVLFVRALTESHRKLAHAALRVLSVSAMSLAVVNCFIVLAIGANSTETRVGKVATVGQESTLRLLNHYVSRGEEVLIYPYCPTCYFLSTTNNPTRYSILVHHYNTPAQFQEVINILDRRRVKYVVWDTTLQTKVLQEAFPGSGPKGPDDLILEHYIESNYQTVEDDQGIRMMERR